MTISNFGRNLKAIRERNNITQQEFADAIGVTQTTVSAWETREKLPRQKSIVKRICELFDVDEQDLYGYEDGFFAKQHGFTSKTLPLGAFNITSSSPAYLRLSGVVHAGKAEEPDILDELVPVPFEIAERHPNAYLLIVEGDCMSKVYPEGSLIAIDPDVTPQNGSIAVVSIDGADYIMRRLLKGASTLILSPDSYNSEWEDIVITADDEHTVEFHGVVVWYQSAKEMS